MDCRLCKNYSKPYCKLIGHTPFADGTIGAKKYNMFGKIFVDGKYKDCKDFENKKKLTIFDFIKE